MLKTNGTWKARNCVFIVQYESKKNQPLEKKINRYIVSSFINITFSYLNLLGSVKSTSKNNLTTPVGYIFIFKILSQLNVHQIFIAHLLNEARNYVRGVGLTRYSIR